MKAQIGVLVVTDTTRIPTGFPVLKLPANSGHDHPDGQTCVACAAHTDVRAHLFDLMQDIDRGVVPPTSRVVVDASAVRNPLVVLEALTGKRAAMALRDHAVARKFFLEALLE